MKTAEVKSTNSSQNPGRSDEPFFSRKWQSGNSSVNDHFFNYSGPVSKDPSSRLILEKSLNASAEPLLEHGFEHYQNFDSNLITANKWTLHSNSPQVQSKCSECDGQDHSSEKEPEDVTPGIQQKSLEIPKSAKEGSIATVDLKSQQKAAPVGISINSSDNLAGQNSIQPRIQAKCSDCEKEEKEENIAGEPDVKKKAVFDCATDPPEDREGDIQPNVQTNHHRPGTTPVNASTGNIENRVNQTKGKGSPLDKSIKGQMESAFGANFDGVNIHTGSVAVSMNKDLRAQAFTHGKDLYFNQDKYRPDTTSGQHLLAHELTHVLQQRQEALAPKIQKYSWQEFVDDATESVESAQETLEEAGQAFSDTAEKVGENIRETGEAIGDTISEAGTKAGDLASRVGESVMDTGQRVYRAGEDVYESGIKVIEIAQDVTNQTLDWLVSEAGQAAKSLASSLGGMLTVSPSGIIITVPKVCPIPAIPLSFKLPKIKKEYMVPVVALPIGPDLLITGEIGLTGNIAPKLELQAGPFCLNGVRVEINPLTGSYSISGSISATIAAALGAEVRGGVRGELSLSAIIPIGGIPVPVSVPVIGIEGGLAGIISGIGVNTLTMGGSLAYNRGVITGTTSGTLDMGLGAAIFLGAYGQLDVLGQNLCRIYWQPWSWFGGIGASLSASASFAIRPGLTPTLTPVFGVPSLKKIPFDQFPLVIGKKGFSDDCPLIEKTCEVLKNLGYLPSQNGGVWNWTATGHGGTYGPGRRLDGPLEVYEKNPAIPSGAECRGACGPNCDTCTPLPLCRYIDPSTGIIWEYVNFQNCNSNDGCRQHDAAFDWAADKKGETGDWAIIMPWHMAANIECACNNLAGNCIAWIAGLPPYDRKMYFAESAKQLTYDRGAVEVKHSRDPFGEWGSDFYHYSKDAPTGNFSANVERWTDYHTNCRAEAQAATGVPDDFNYVTILSDDDADAYLDRNNFTTRWFSSIIHGVLATANHYINFCEIPPDDYLTTALDIFTPDCSAGASAFGDEESELERCDRNELPPDYCEELYNRVIERFGNRDRDLGFDPDTDVDESRTRVDDAPVISSFRQMYNRLDSWNIFVQNRHPDLYQEFNTKFEVSRKKVDWTKELKERVANYKNRFRDVSRQDVESLKREFINRDLEEFQQRIDKLIHEIAIWYKAKTGIADDLQTIIEKVHREGTELWRAAWRAAILAVNRILSRLWPPAKNRIEIWVQERKREHPGEDLEGIINDLDYIGSLAVGYKGAPKQFIRFNPDKFDVDANLNALPLAKFAMNIRGIDPDRGRIFAIGNNTGIMPLIIFCQDTHRELSGVHGYDTGDQFDVVIEAEDRPEQRRSTVGSEKLYQLRDEMSPERYSQLIGEVRNEGLLIQEGGGWRLKPKLTEDEGRRLNEMLCRYGL